MALQTQRAQQRLELRTVKRHCTSTMPVPRFFTSSRKSNRKNPVTVNARLGRGEDMAGGEREEARSGGREKQRQMVDDAVVRWRTYVPASCLLMFTFGSSYALATFLIPLYQVDASFVSPFTSALGVQSFAIAISMLVGGYLLDAKPASLRAFLVAGALVIVLSVFGIIYAISADSPAMLFWCTSLVGFGLGTYYIAGVEHIAQWMPELEGLAMGFGMGSLGFGSIVGSKVIPALISTVGLINAWLAVMLALSVTPILLLPFLKFPPRGWDPRVKTAVIEGSVSGQSQEVGRKLQGELLLQPAFYLLLTIVAMGAGPGYGAMVSMPTIMRQTFDFTSDQVSSLFAIMQVLSMCTRFGIGALVDKASFGCGFFWSGAKNLCIFVLATQCLVLLLAQKFADSEALLPFEMCIAVLLMSFAASAVLAAVMSRQIFSPVNAAVVFGFAGGLTDGLTTMMFSILIANIEDAAYSSGLPGHKWHDPYYSLCFWFSLLGLMCAILIQRCGAAFEVISETGDVIEIIESSMLSEKRASSRLPDMHIQQVASKSDSFEEHLSHSLSRSVGMRGGFSLRSEDFAGRLKGSNSRA
ncbi:hypothetical protein FVE85_0592 [Porphyridium purpureum]|uniref:Major facilitator superfamily (MFS) profile domain-containing protein n=1 Tax=Porphyridium purpureum TaxID=35688 RepID=A0A5J4Z1U8_PORPP|nr:hypothetical protein FVE85_0592 [Porphyridium purpureum]|eukprot:POR8763..scf208_2